MTVYKTIVHELLEQNPVLHERLRKERSLLSTLELYSSELKTSHEAWKKLLLQSRPGSNETQIASEALEIAVEKLQAHLSPESPPDENNPLSLDEAMAFIRRHTPPA